MTATERDDYAKLTAAIRRYTPILGEYVDSTKTIGDFTGGLWAGSIDDTQARRQQHLVRCSAEYIERICAQKLEMSVPLSINVVDHHAPLTHPILVATNLVANIHTLVNGVGSAPIVAFSSGIVPPNNFLNRKGFHLSGKSVPLFGVRDIHKAGYFLDSRSLGICANLRRIGRWREFGRDEQAFLVDFEQRLAELETSCVEDYKDQVTLINRLMWKQLFHTEVRDRVQDLFHIPGEEVCRIGLNRMLTDESSFLHRCLFDEEFRTLVLERFMGISGCWDRSRRKGTHFFWYRTPDNRPGRLFVRGDRLVSADEQLHFELSPSMIMSALEEKRIIPGLFLIYGWIVFWCGVRPLVGYASGTYLTQMREAWLDLRDMGAEDIRRIRGIDTKGLIGGYKITYRRSERTLREEYALDVAFRGGLTQWYLEQVHRMQMKDLMLPALPDIYESYVPEEARETLSFDSQEMVEKAFAWLP